MGGQATHLSHNARNVNNRLRPPSGTPAVRLQSITERGVRCSLARSYLTTDTVYKSMGSAARPGGLAAPDLAAPPMFVCTIYCEATTHSVLLETGIRKIKTGHRGVTFDQKTRFLNLSSNKVSKIAPGSRLVGPDRVGGLPGCAGMVSWRTNPKTVQKTESP